MLKEFKEFAMKGNILDLAVGVIIGGAFQKIVTSLVNDILMPFLSIFTGDVDFSDLSLTIGNASIKYGAFITAIIDFLIIAFSIFIMIKYINKMNSKLEEISEKNIKKINNLRKGKGKKAILEETEVKKEEPTVKTCPYCMSEINYNATRCPHCTSILEETSNKEV